MITRNFYLLYFATVFCNSLNNQTNLICTSYFKNRLECLYFIPNKWNQIDMSVNGDNVNFQKLSFYCNKHFTKQSNTYFTKINCTWNETEFPTISQQEKYVFTINVTNYRSESQIENYKLLLEQIINLEKPVLFSLNNKNKLTWKFDTNSIGNIEKLSNFRYNYRINITDITNQLETISFTTLYFKNFENVYLKPDTNYNFTLEMQVLKRLDNHSHWSDPAWFNITTNSSGYNIIQAPKIDEAYFTYENPLNVTIKWEIFAENFFQYYKINIKEDKHNGTVQPIAPFNYFKYCEKKRSFPKKCSYTFNISMKISNSEFILSLFACKQDFNNVFFCSKPTLLKIKQLNFWKIHLYMIFLIPLVFPVIVLLLYKLLNNIFKNIFKKCTVKIRVESDKISLDDLRHQVEMLKTKNIHEINIQTRNIKTISKSTLKTDYVSLCELK